MNPLAAVTIAALVSACAAGMRTPAHAHPFCESGHVVLPGEYLGTVGLRSRDGSIVRVVPLLAGDTVCLRRKPVPPPPLPPAFADSAKPTTA